MPRYRTEPYKEDSTDGKSVINPIRYKGDVLVQVWVDSRVLASLALWLEKSGKFPRFMSDVVRIPLYSMLDVLAEAGDAEMIDDTSEARKLLERWFRVNLNRGDKGMKNILHNQVLSDRRKDLAERISKVDSYKDVVIPARKRKADSKVVDEALRRYRELEESEGKKLVDKEVKRAEASGIVADSPRKLSEEEVREKEREIEEDDKSVVEELNKEPDLEFMEKSDDRRKEGE